MDLLEKTVLFDKYRIIQQLDKTNFVTVYLGEHLHTSEYVLIQMMNPFTITKLESERARFLKEMKVIRNFEHPSLLRVYDAGEYDDTICIVFEYFDGIPLNRYIEQNKTLDIKTALNIAEQIATGLRYAQSFNVLHRTLRTPSILILEQDGEVLVKVMDFAIAYIIEYSSFANTDIDYSFGFLAPETTGVLDRPVDQRSDLYSLGIILYQMVTGCLPFHSDTMDNMVYKHLAVPVKAPSDINSKVPTDVSNIITKLISKDPDLRYSTANEFISDIDKFMSDSEFGHLISDNDILHGFNRKAKMYSRHKELTQLKEKVEESFETEGHFILVHGTSGSGKSDLMNNLYQDLTKHGTVALRCSFKSQYKMTPYSAFQQLLSEFATIYSTYERKYQITEKNRLSQIIGGLTDTVTRISPIMSSVLTEAVSLPHLDDYKEQQRSYMLLSTFMLSLLRDEKPYCIMFDDMQHADSSSLSLICEMAERVSSHKVAIVVTMRDFESPEENPLLASVVNRLKSCAGFFDLPLKPFNETRMCEYLSEILNLPRQECNILTTYMIEKTDGNPYYTINVLRSMLEDGVITIANRTIEHDWDKLRSVNSEHDVISIIMRKMELLDEDAVNLLEIAAVIGYEFPLELLSYITDVKVNDMLPWIDHAVSMQFINYASARKTLISFAHKQIYEVFLSRISPAREKELHYWIAKGIEAKYSGETSQHLYRLVYHFLMADDVKGMRKYCLDAAHLAESSNANEEAISYYRQALDLMGTRSSSNMTSWIAIKKSLINLNLTTGHFNDALQIANELLPLIEDRLEKAKLYKNIGIGHFRQGNFRDCIMNLMTALKSLEFKFPSSETEMGLMLHSLKANVKFSSGSDITKSRSTSLSDAMRRDNDISEDDKVIVSILETLIWVYAYTNKTSFNYTLLRLYTYAIKKFGNSPELGFGASALVIYYGLNNEKKKAKLAQSMTLTLRKSIGDKFGYARSLFISGIFSIMESDHTKAVKYLQEALDVFREIGDMWEINNIYIYLGMAYYMSGRFEEGREVCENSIALSKKLNDKFTLLISSSLNVGCLACRGNFSLAEAAAESTARLNDELPIPFAQCFYRNMVGVLKLEQGKFESAEKHLNIAQNFIDTIRFVETPMLSVTAHLAIAKISLFQNERNSLLQEMRVRQEAYLKTLCLQAMSDSRPYPCFRIPAYRACAKYAYMTNKAKKADDYYKEGIILASETQNLFDNALIHYEYGIFLLDQHRTEESRYNIFDAYMNFSSLNASVYIKKCEELITSRYADNFISNSLMADISSKQNRMNVDRKVNTLLRMGERLTSTLEIDELQNKILQDAVELAGAERGILFLYPEIGEKKLYVASIFNTGNFDSYSYDWILEDVELTNQPVVINDVQSDEFRKNYSQMVRYGIKSVMAMPMFVRGKLYGVIYLDSRLVRGIFSNEYMETIGFIANQSGAPIENARLYHRAITDGLTQLYGRSYLDNLIIDKTNDAAKSKLSALMLDVDFFKKCNDTYGHQFGDEVLKQVASIMKKITGNKGTACRYGGEEFVILLDSNNSETAISVAEKIRQTIETTSVPFNEGSKVTLVSITVSIGVSIWDPKMERVELIEHADKALYAAKNGGRNQVILWSKDLG